MSAYDPRVDEYIAKSAAFAQPILEHLREVIHRACPGVSETIKWGFPNFEFNKGILCSMASFKQHCAFTFWNGKFMSDPQKILEGVGEKSSMGQLGRIKAIEDLPAESIFISYLQEAMSLQEGGIKAAAKQPKAPAKELPVPEDLIAALEPHAEAKKHFEAFSPSHRKEYIQWITEAKTEATRNKRIAASVDMIKEGKGRNWKYKK